MRGTKRIRVPDQAARLLALLLENPGAVVTHDQLKAELWPEGQLQDYDHSIHRVVSQLREILRDRSSKSTRFIETLPKRGYRFAMPVKTVSQHEEVASPSVLQVDEPVSPQMQAAPDGVFEFVVEAEVPHLAGPAELPRAMDADVAAPRVRRRYIWIALASVCLLLAGLGGWRFWMRFGGSSQPLSPGDRPVRGYRPKRAGPRGELPFESRGRTFPVAGD